MLDGEVNVVGFGLALVRGGVSEFVAVPNIRLDSL